MRPLSRAKGLPEHAERHVPCSQRCTGERRGWSSTADGEDEGKEARGREIAESRREGDAKTRGNITQHAGKKERQSAHVCVSYVAVLGNDDIFEFEKPLVNS